jgi:hypothetical protein
MDVVVWFVKGMCDRNRGLSLCHVCSWFFLVALWIYVNNCLFNQGLWFYDTNDDFLDWVSWTS